MTPPPPTAKQQSTNVQRQTGDNGGMRWKTTAAEELRQPLGYRWDEDFTGVNAPKMGAGGGGVNNPTDDKRRMLPPPKPKRPIKNL